MCKACHALPCEDRQRRKINCSLQNALVEKAARWAAMCYAGYATHSNSASAAPQNQLQLANRTRRKICTVGCGVPRVQRNSIGINRRGYSGYGGLEKVIEKSEKLKLFSSGIDRITSPAYTTLRP